MKKTLISISALIAVLSLVVVLVYAQGGSTQETSQTHGSVMTSFTPDEIFWADGPSSLPKGAQMAVLSGDPSKPGMFVMRVLLPANYVIPPHWHPADENVTVVSGTFYMGRGTVVDKSKAKQMPEGSFTHMPSGLRHYAFTGNSPVVVQLHGVGPWGIT